MKLLYIDFWSIHEQLTISTVFPTIRALEKLPEVEAIVLVTIERNQDAVTEVDLPFKKLKHIPVKSVDLGAYLLTKLGDFVFFPKKIKKIALREKTDLIVARTASAGALAYLVHQKTGLPFIVESFEPHADYMHESMVWKKRDPRYIFQKIWEKGQKAKARFLITVSENYKQHLEEKEAISGKKVKVIPCTVSTENFSFNEKSRAEYRKNLGISKNAIVSIYVGKFGDIYYDEEAFQIFKSAFDFFGANFRLIILSPNKEDIITQKLEEAGIDKEKVFIKFVPHKEISAYLSAADFAFSTIRPAKSRVFCSPVKDGEYWASGLPIILTDKVGDDYKLIPELNVGAIFNLNESGSVKKAFERTAEILEEDNYRTRIMKMAEKHRSNKIIGQVYAEIFSKL